MGHQVEEPRFPDFVTGVLEDFSENFRLNPQVIGNQYFRRRAGRCGGPCGCAAREEFRWKKRESGGAERLVLSPH
jgi:hypothetical protein